MREKSGYLHLIQGLEFDHQKSVLEKMIQQLETEKIKRNKEQLKRYKAVNNR